MVEHEPDWFIQSLVRRFQDKDPPTNRWVIIRHCVPDKSRSSYTGSHKVNSFWRAEDFGKELAIAMAEVGQGEVERVLGVDCATGEKITWA